MKKESIKCHYHTAVHFREWPNIKLTIFDLTICITLRTCFLSVCCSTNIAHPLVVPSTSTSWLGIKHDGCRLLFTYIEVVLCRIYVCVMYYVICITLQHIFVLVVTGMFTARIFYPNNVVCNACLVSHL